MTCFIHKIRFISRLLQWRYRRRHCLCPDDPGTRGLQVLEGLGSLLPQSPEPAQSPRGLQPAEPVSSAVTSRFPHRLNTYSYVLTEHLTLEIYIQTYVNALHNCLFGSAFVKCPHRECESETEGFQVGDLPFCLGVGILMVLSNDICVCQWGLW